MEIKRPINYTGLTQSDAPTTPVCGACTAKDSEKEKNDERK